MPSTPHLFYQPKVKLSGKASRLIGFEGLFRSVHSSGEAIAPSRLSTRQRARLESSSHFLWSLEVATRFMEVLGPSSSLTISLNLPGHLLEQPHFTQRVLQWHHAHRIVIEILETSVIRDVERAAFHLTQLRQAGFQIALDDFGIGHSDLSNLRQLPIDIVKIDMALVTAASGRKSERDFLEGLMNLLYDLGKRVILEGIESEASLTLARDLGAHGLQGYYFGHPMPPHQASRYPLTQLLPSP
ncbi:EAL domain-containing protein [Halomonas sp. I1]|uniref:EAL domain-containing protein n=1 Tax=Halomonas sp. I1 TaxID=393536 RepID=UPI0028DF8C0D|nr:EAL domain-containing protein [Halomonas sp. I1]MDT8896613.1 EAL domain-containing protein [Halomonas sp. I1]